jgi:hypothetical protein
MSIFLIIQAALTTPGLLGLFAAVTFVLVYALRKKFGPQWEKVANIIPALNFDLTPGLTILNKFVQALPGILIAAALGAITSGGSLVPTLLAALAGPLASLFHEFAKWLPILSYKGETGEAKLPGAPRLPTGIAGMMLALSMFGCLGSPKEPCSAADKATIYANYSAEFMKRCAPYESAAACPYTEELRAQRAKDEEKCR